MDKNKEIQSLIAWIERQNALYRTGQTSVFDKEYDAAVERLKLLDPTNHWFKTIEPACVSAGRKRKLPIPMKSLDKVKSIKELKQWAESIKLTSNSKIVITPKFDGVSWLHNEYTGATYSRGGSENEGQDCTEHFRLVQSGKSNDACLANINHTYGELVFSRQAWEKNFAGKTSALSGKIYKSPRNTVAGLINRETPSDELKHAMFWRYGVDDESRWDTYTQLSSDLANVFNQYIDNGEGSVSLYETVELQTIDEKHLEALYRKWSRFVYIDGLVLYVDDLKKWKAVGRHQTTGNPMYAIAYKHPNFTDIFITSVKDVVWKISKSGALKPVVNIEAVDTGDCIIESPTGYHAHYIKTNRIAPGACVEITRSGGIIPKILSVISPATEKACAKIFNDLSVCPHCGSAIIWNESKIELMCTNPGCEGIRFAKMVHFFNVVGADMIGEETLYKMVKAGYDTLRRILDITFDELLRIDTFGECIANTILSSISNIRQGIEVTKLMHASDCFQGIGQMKAKAILNSMSAAERFAFIEGRLYPQSNQRVLDALKLNKTTQSFLSGIGPFYDFVMRNQLKILPIQENIVAIGDKCTGLKVCFTGVRNKELENYIISQGGEIVSGVSGKTTHLIVEDKNTRSSKAQKARQLGIAICTIDEFKAL